jgi:hypothetical protein
MTLKHTITKVSKGISKKGGERYLRGKKLGKKIGSYLAFILGL